MLSFVLVKDLIMASKDGKSSTLQLDLLTSLSFLVSDCALLQELFFSTDLSDDEMLHKEELGGDAFAADSVLSVAYEED